MHADETAEDRVRADPTVDEAAVVSDLESLALNRLDDVEVFRALDLAQHDIANLDVLLLWNVGAVYPMLRTHTLLTALHAHMKDTPLVMFYPGKYDGFSLRLFNKLKDDHYYRAFQLVS